MWWWKSYVTFISLIDRIPADKWYAWWSCCDIIVVSAPYYLCAFAISWSLHRNIHIFIYLSLLMHMRRAYIIYTYTHWTRLHKTSIICISLPNYLRLPGQLSVYTYVNFLNFVVGNVHTRRQSVSHKRDALKSISRVMFTGLGVCKLYKSLCV